MKTNQMRAVSVLLILFSVFTLHAQMNMGTTKDHIMVMPADIKWGEAPPGLPAGSKAAVLEGNPGAAEMYTIRAKMPANYIIMPHYHAVDEHVTVLEGACYMGVGDKYDEKTATLMMPGAFAVMKAGTHHYFFTKKPCIIQVHGMGPFGITYINAADDPRNKK
ncbi:MAG: cupin [Bacteroidota bacterium]|nr:cupin [Bacteroidota bacterium]